MQRTHIYLPEELSREINNTAKAQKKSKSVIIREALEKGVKANRPKKSSSAKALVNLAKLAEAIPTRGRLPKDFSKNLNFYTWGGKKRE